ncbi:MAG: Tad domain-containing protein [Mariniblastus sp.]|nr:Tad domain-containing protein [Mariniblastus sp.]MDG2182449.1 Tad domain-containing protein [Mariniblastus sp.]
MSKLTKTRAVGQQGVRSAVSRLVCRVHRDQSGSISVVTVFAFIFLTMVLGMLMNVGRHADRKVKIQNAADAATITGSTVLARGMNTLVFTNHLMCDVFALTAYLREARDRNAESLTPEILEKWNSVAPEFADAPHTKFSDLAEGIPAKTPLEQELITAFAEQNSMVSESLLPVMEEILNFEMIPEFQRALVIALPQLSVTAADEVASRLGPTNRGLAGSEPMRARMWRTNGEEFEAIGSTGFSQMPVADPINDISQRQPEYFSRGISERKTAANRYLNYLNRQMLQDFDEHAKMSQFANLWRGFSKAYLLQLLEEEYPDTNVPYQIRRSDLPRQSEIETDYMFVGVSYWEVMSERMPGLFSNPNSGVQVAYAQSRLFIPRGRLYHDSRFAFPEGVSRHRVSSNHDLMNQNWVTRLVPATASAIPQIIQTSPTNLPVDVPSLGGINVEEFQQLNTH